MPVEGVDIYLILEFFNTLLSIILGEAKHNHPQLFNTLTRSFFEILSTCIIFLLSNIFFNRLNFERSCN